jgi:hypothetical protein
MAEQICKGFKAHDDREREASIEAFAETDVRQFAHLDRETAREAAVAYVDALWAKDAVENTTMADGELDREAIADADWGPVESAFRRRAELVGMDHRYAIQSTLAWRNHKCGRDYWTPMRWAQIFELRAALQDPDYPDKPEYGQSGHGPEPARYAVAVELHDMHSRDHWEQATETMQPYFEKVLDAH